MSKIKVRKPNGEIVEIPLGSTINIGGGGGSCECEPVIVDQTFSPTSENPQSGVAVQQAIEQSIGDVSSALEELHAYATSLAGGSAQ